MASDHQPPARPQLPHAADAVLDGPPVELADRPAEVLARAERATQAVEELVEELAALLVWLDGVHRSPDTLALDQLGEWRSRLADAVVDAGELVELDLVIERLGLCGSCARPITSADVHLIGPDRYCEECCPDVSCRHLRTEVAEP